MQRLGWMGAVALMVLWTSLALAQDDSTDDLQRSEPDAVAAPMTLDRLAQILVTLDPETQRTGARFALTLADVPVLVVTDPLADRMRAMVPIRATQDMTSEELLRVLQANFDTALDARYAIARGRLWGVFIHPLSSLNGPQLISGLGQTVNVALTYGSSYSSGAMSFSQGDTGDAQRALIEELLKRGEDI